MSNLKRILEVMNYQVGKPLTEQKNILLESYVLKFPAIFDIFKNVKYSVDRIQIPMSKWGELENKLNSLFPNKSFDEQINELRNKMSSSGPGFGNMTETDAKLIDELLESCWKELVGYVDNLPKIEDRIAWWKLFNDNADDVIYIRNQINSISNIDAATSKSFIEELRKIKTNLSSINQTYPYGKLIPDCEQIIDELLVKLSPKINKGNSLHEFIKILDFEDFVTSLNKWVYTFFKTPLKKPELGISDYQQLLDNIKKLSDEIEDELNTPIEVGGGSFNEQKFRKLSEYIFMFKRDWDQDIYRYFEDAHNQGYIGDDLFEYVKKQKESGEGNIFIEWIDEVDIYRKASSSSPEGKKARTAGLLGWADEFQGYKEIFKYNPIFLVARTFTENGRKGLTDDALKLANRAFWLAIWADPRTPRELIKLRNVRGTTRLTLVGGKILSVLVAQVAFGLAYSAILTTIQRGLEWTEQFTGKEGTVKWGPDEYMDPNWNGWDKYWENAKNLIPDEFEKFFDGDVTFMEVTKAFFGTFTNLDNIWNTVQHAMNSETSKEDTQKAKSELEKALERLEQLKKEIDNTTESERKKYEEELKKLQDEIERLKKENGENDENDGGTESGGGEQEQGPIVSGLESEMKTAFNNWAASNGDRSPQWISFSNNIGKVKINGTEKNVQQLSSGKIVIMGTDPLIILN